MSGSDLDFLKSKADASSMDKLLALGDDALVAFVAKYAALGRPDSVRVCDDSDEDVSFVRRLAIETSEEAPLALEGQTVHFDGYQDQARDKAMTKYLLAPGAEMGTFLNATDREAGLEEVHGFLKDNMRGHTMIVRFFCLGPTNSPFSLRCVQITDSAYVAHSEDLLYRRGYEEFRRTGGAGGYFRFVHSQGELENGVSKHVEKRRVYIDLDENIVYSTNTQYGGNTIGLKKLSLRLAIRKADREGWLAEHMFLLAVNGPGGRASYFAGAYPSACGKTSTAMLPGERILGDDIAYFRAIDGEARAVNVEGGIFGIIRDANAEDDPVIWQALTQPGEVIFSNVLIACDNKPYWLGDGRKAPKRGRNHSGEWAVGKRDAKDVEITLSHKNARYTIALARLENLDPAFDQARGVPLSAVIYGGRDSDTTVPVQESFDWAHGILTMGAALESETTAATLGAEGVRTFNLMSNLDFVSIPLGRYIENNLRFAEKLERAPRVYGVNYFLRGADGKYLNGMHDKHVWIKWIELRCHGDVDAIKTPTGRVPVYADLARLFGEVLDAEYTEAAYEEQFSTRVPQLLAKIDRIEAIYREKVPDAPASLFDALAAQRGRLEAARETHGGVIAPGTFAH